jgi:transposase
MLPGANFNGAGCRDFLRQLLKNIRGPVFVVWDRLNAHRSHEIKAFLSTTRGRLQLFSLPPYAPELNPIEMAWSYLKWHELANVAPTTEEELYQHAKRGMCKTRRQRRLLESFIDHTPLSFFD